MKGLERRLVRLGPVVARLHPPPRPPVGEDRLTAGEWAEAARIGAIMREGGVETLSVADLELAACLAGKLAGEEVATCLG